MYIFFLFDLIRYGLMARETHKYLYDTIQIQIRKEDFIRHPRPLSTTDIVRWINIFFYVECRMLWLHTDLGIWGKHLRRFPKFKMY